MPRLTDQSVAKYIKEAPGLGPTANSPGGMWIGDSSLSGLYLRLWPTGAASYAVKKRLGRRVLTRTVGPAEHLSLAVARQKAALILIQLEAGVDPLEVKRRDIAKRRSEYRKGNKKPR